MSDIDLSDDQYNFTEEADAMIIEAREEELKREEKKLKRKLLWTKIKQSPALVLIYIRILFFGSIKVWGSTLLVIFLYILYANMTFHIAYYNILSSWEVDRIVSIENYLERKNTELQGRKEDLLCYQNQIQRIASQKDVDINFCKNK